MIRFGKYNLKDYESSISKEYLITNGLGGYCSSTICGSNIRKYNALLVACLNPPVDRRLLLSKLDETLYIGNEEISLFTNEYTDKSIDRGFLNQLSFEQEYFPIQNYEVRGVLLSKKVTMVYGSNTTVVSYKIVNNNKPLKIMLDALINNRDHHGNTEKDDFKCTSLKIKNGVKISYDINDIELYLKSDKANFIEAPRWAENIFYFNEYQRGLADFDNHFIPGYFEIEVHPNETKEFSIIASTEDILDLNGENYFISEKRRKEELIEKLQVKDELTKQLCLASDQFIVKRKSTNTSTVIAGYPWFTDWGRDTMIALPGLTLSTGRFEEAKELLITFAKYEKEGLIPNMFPDTGIEPMYNTIDATLWYFNAVHKFLEYTNDYKFIREQIFPTLTSMIKNHINGTMHEIRMDKEDSLLRGGNKDIQLTWMDVKIEDWTVTPRQGKAVEINALWYNAVCIYSKLCKEFELDNSYYDQLSSNIKDSFNKKFWNASKNYFYDYIDGSEYNDQIRPNGIIALSLPYTMIDEEKAKKAIETAFEKLYTPYGLRSLAYDDNEYKGIFIGGIFERDSAYHQGTVWSWLIGPFITAINRWYKDKSLCLKVIEPFYDHIEDRCVGNISEVFDGNSPNTARACFAQAWGAAELLRAYIEDVAEYKQIVK
ncbi:putative glycogen debranching enzyme, type [Clostridiales bacterium oral taxon 876 str. F0540]|nr:putative glycogen debranching enzyme, type [Clostridiales bacterium oral taxon 876 str. F0540]